MQARGFRHLAIVSLLVSFTSITAPEVAAQKVKNLKEPVLLDFGSSCIIAFWPISGSSGQNADVMTSPFGIRYDSADDYDFHEGIDIRAGSPMSVYAYTHGTVAEVVDDGSQFTDNFVTFEHTDPCDGDVFYTGYHHLSDTNFLEEDDPVSAGIPYVVSGNSGAEFYHLHFAGLVGGLDRATNAINPMRDDSFVYLNDAPEDIVVSECDEDFINFQVHTPDDNLDLNEIEVRAFGSEFEFDSFSMNFDTRAGVDARFHCPDQTCENGDEDGEVTETTDQQNYTINYELSSFNFNPDNDNVHKVQVDVTFPQ